MIDFPITDLFDDSLCLVWLERHLPALAMFQVSALRAGVGAPTPGTIPHNSGTPDLASVLACTRRRPRTRRSPHLAHHLHADIVNSGTCM